ncbi:MAG: hypothetical protein DRR19_17130 [Candidatus Parabeggiatoa sp. nov. 1]|nr:MAG: hypothetical protein DRR19_17130 [Gammaproteobacteria bacterium]
MIKKLVELNIHLIFLIGIVFQKNNLLSKNNVRNICRVGNVFWLPTKRLQMVGSIRLLPAPYKKT